jgi:tripartite ATP-independent transporter DctP family solute receptor
MLWKAASCTRVAAIMACMLFPGCNAVVDDESSPREWRFALEEPVGSVQHAYALRFQQKIEERTQGRITVTIYPYGELGTSDQITEQLQLGAVQFAMASPGHLGKLVPEIQVFLLHFALSDREEVNRAVLGDERVKAAIDELYAEKGMRFLSAFSEGWQVWTTRKPIHEPADFQGVKMRVMTSPLLLAAYAAYGASPTPLPYSEVYSALQLNMIDGQVNPIFAIQEMSFHEVTDWLTFPNHAPFITTVVAGRDFFETLSPADRELVLDVATELEEEIFRVQQRFNQDRLLLIREQRPDIRVETLTEEQRDAFRVKSRSVADAFDKLTGERGAALRTLLEAVVDEEEEEERRRREGA